MMAPTTPARRSNAWKVAVLLGLGAGVAGCIAVPPFPPHRGIYGKVSFVSCLPSFSSTGSDFTPLRDRKVCAVEASLGSVCTTTNASGNYSLELPAGSWRVCMPQDGHGEGDLACDCLEIALKDGTRSRRDRMVSAGGGNWQGADGSQMCSADGLSLIDDTRDEP
jgi:hypothetical protein